MIRPQPPLPALGIDFGTSHTIAVVRRADGSVRPLLFDGAPLMPSAVCAGPDGELHVGNDALHTGRRHPERFEPNPKRLIDRGSILLGEHEYRVVDLIAAVLSAVADECRRVVGAPRQVTITVPAVWGPTRRRVIETSAAASGLGPVRLVPEPVAAATYYAETLKHHIPIGQSLVVYDLGAGTFDASVVRRTGHGFETTALDGRGDLGGLDIDAALIEHLGTTYGDHEAWPRLTDPTTAVERRRFREFREEIRGAKERLSRHQQVDIAIPLLEVDAHLTRAELEQIAAPHLERTIQVTRAVIGAAGLDPDGGAGVFLVGGASRMPLVATVLHRALGVAPTVLDQPEVVVAEGSVLWTEPPPGPASPVTPQTRPAPTQVAPATPPAGPTGPIPASLPPKATAPAEPPPSEAERAEKKRRTKRIVLAVVLVDILIVAALLLIFRPDGGDGGDGGDATDHTGVTAEPANPAASFELEDETTGHEGPVRAVATAPDGRYFTAGGDRIVKRWDSGSVEAEHELENAVLGMTVVEHSDGDPRALIVDGGFGLYLWHPDEPRPETVQEPVEEFDPGAVERLAAGAHGGRAALAAMSEAGYGVFDLEARTELTSGVEFTDEQRNGYSNFAVFDDAINVVSVTAAGEVALYDPVTGEASDLEFEDSADWDADDAPESLTVVRIDGVPHAMVLKEGDFHFWNLETGGFGGSTGWGPDTGSRLVNEAVPVGDGHALIVYGGDSGAELADIATGEPIAGFSETDSADPSPVSSAATGDDGGDTITITGHDDGTVRLWKLEEG